MQNTSIFIKNGTQNLENLQLFRTFAIEMPKQGKTPLRKNALKSTMLRKFFLTFKYNLIWKTFFGKKKI